MFFSSSIKFIDDIKMFYSDCIQHVTILANIIIMFLAQLYNTVYSIRDIVYSF